MKGGSVADVYVFPKALQDEQEVPLLAGMQRGMTPNLERFTANFTGAFNGGVVNVLSFIESTDSVGASRQNVRSEAGEYSCAKGTLPLR